jgi:uncharacterized membrane protein YgaE (UPF0421/DUF939 family)
VAAGLAWYIARDLLGHPQPFFAPIAAAVSLSASNVLRSQRAVQLILGVALGIGIGVGVAAFLDGAVAIGLAVLIAMSAALVLGAGFLGRGLMFVNQTAASAILVIAIRHSGTGTERLIDALIGGGLVLVFSVLLFPADPCRLLTEASRDLGATLRDTLRDLLKQIALGEAAGPRWPRVTGERVHSALARVGQARATARVILRVAPLMWRRAASIEAAIERSNDLDLLGNSMLGLLRATHAALAAGEQLDAVVIAEVFALLPPLEVLAERGLNLGDGTADADGSRPWSQLSPHGMQRYGPLVAALADACARDLLRLRQGPARQPGNPAQGAAG